MRDIAARAGISLGNLYNHFPGKHDVLVELAALERDELNRFIKELAGPSAAPKVFERFVSSYARYFSAHENVILSIEISSEAIRQKDLGALFADNHQTLVTALENLLKRGAENDDFRLPAGARHTAEMVLDLIEGRAYHCVLSGASMRSLLPELKALLFSAIGAAPR